MFKFKKNPVESFRFAIIGFIFSLIVMIILFFLMPSINWNFSQSIVLFGAPLAGALAVFNDSNAHDAGLSMGLISFIFNLIITMIESYSTITPVMFITMIFIFIVMLIISVLFGILLGKLGGWIAEKYINISA